MNNKAIVVGRSKFGANVQLKICKPMPISWLRDGTSLNGKATPYSHEEANREVFLERTNSRPLSRNLQLDCYLTYSSHPARTSLEPLVLCQAGCCVHRPPLSEASGFSLAPSMYGSRSLRDLSSLGALKGANQLVAPPRKTDPAGMDEWPQGDNVPKTGQNSL